MLESDVAALTARVLWVAFAIGGVFGAIAQRTHFCTMGALADLVSMGDSTRMRMWAMAAGFAIIGFNALVGLGRLQVTDTIYAGSSVMVLSLVIGGLMFGAGMVLASGCGSKTLVRVGGGNLKALVVLLVMGLSAWATLRGAAGLLRVRLLDPVQAKLAGSQDLPSVLARAWGEGSGIAWAPVVGAVMGGALLAWALWSREARRAGPLLGGLGIGACVLALWATTGLLGHLEEHPVTLERAFLATASQGIESFTFVAPVAYLMEYVVFASDASRQLGVGAVAALGVALGSTVVALLSGSFRWEGFSRVDDLARHLIGAVLMGVGGVTALGCTIGQGLSGLSTLSLGSLLATASIMLGGWATLRWELWRLERQA